MHRKPTIIALMNNSMEDYIKKGLSSVYPDYINVKNFFDQVTILYRYQKGGKARAFGMDIIKVRNIPLLSPMLMLIKMLRFIKKKRPSIIRAYNTQLEGLVAVICQKLTGVPAVVSIHSDFNHLVKVRGYPSYVRIAVNVAQKYVVRRARNTWCITPYLAKLAIKEGAYPSRVKVIYNKIRIEQFQNALKFRKVMRRKLKLERSFTVLFVGRFNKAKNIETILRAINILRNKRKNVKLILCGDDAKGFLDAPYRQFLEAECKKLGIADVVIFTGFVRNDELPKYYGASDSFVLVERGLGFGIVIVEAQAAGLPIIVSEELATKVGIVVDPSNSLLVNPDNHEDLASQISKLMENPKLWHSLSEASKKSAIRYEWNRIAKLEAEFYKELIKIR